MPDHPHLQSQALRPLRSRDRVGLRLFCFPYAGGSIASFAHWPDVLPTWVDVRPVRIPRPPSSASAPAGHLTDLVAQLVNDLQPLLDLPAAFFGHSMGAVLAYEIARELRRLRQPLPIHLYMSGHRAPHIADVTQIDPSAPDDDFIARVVELGGTPPEVIADRELMAMVLPALRADFEMCRTYTWIEEPPLSCPITVFAGVDDEEGADDLVNGWQAHTTKRLAVLRFPGDHFFLHNSAAALLHALGTSLVASLGRPRASGA